MTADPARPALVSWLSLLLAGGCVTGNSSDHKTAAASAESFNSIAANEAAAAIPGDVPPDPELGGYTLGRLNDESLRRSIYAGFEKRLSRRQDLGKGQEEVVEIGDYDSFQFTVTKLTSGEDDVSADPTQAPDALEIEVSGWYRKSLLEGGDSEPTGRCFSFDAMAPLVRQGKGWGLPNDYKIAFAREDHEDCF